MKCALLSKKRFKKWLWIAYNSKRKQVLDFEIGGREARTFDKLFRRLEKQYKITKYYTDNYPVYKELIPHKRYKTGKKYTQQIENLNGRIRHYIKGFNRKIKGYFKTAKWLKMFLNCSFGAILITKCQCRFNYVLAK